MNQHSTIFDAAFEAENPPRRRDILPKWLKIYTLCVIGFAIAFSIWSIFLAPDNLNNDPRASNPEFGKSYKTGHRLGELLPAFLFIMMGLTVWLERRRAILFNIVVAIFWGVAILLATMASGWIGLTVGIMLPVFIPYWIGLFQIKHKWEKEAVRGKGII